VAFFKLLSRGFENTKFALKHFGPWYKVLPLVALSYAKIHGFSTFMHHAVNLDLQKNGRKVPVRVSSLFESMGIIRKLAEGHYDLGQMLPPKPTIIDCGAHVGFSVLHFKDKYPDSMVYGIEPSKEQSELLAFNTADIEGVRISREAVSDKTGEAPLFLSNVVSVCNSLHEDMVGKVSKVEKVPLVTLKGFMAARGIQKVDLLKLDVEGSELDALKGLGGRVKDVGAIVGELHLKKVGMREFRNFLVSKGFKFQVKKESDNDTLLFHALNKRIYEN